MPDDAAEETAKFIALQNAIRDGLESGMSERSVPQIMADVEARLKNPERHART